MRRTCVCDGIVFHTLPGASSVTPITSCALCAPPGWMYLASRRRLAPSRPFRAPTASRVAARDARRRDATRAPDSSRDRIAPAAPRRRSRTTMSRAAAADVERRRAAAARSSCPSTRSTPRSADVQHADLAPLGESTRRQARPAHRAAAVSPSGTAPPSTTRSRSTWRSVMRAGREQAAARESRAQSSSVVSVLRCARVGKSMHA